MLYELFPNIAEVITFMLFKSYCSINVDKINIYGFKLHHD